MKTYLIFLSAFFFIPFFGHIHCTVWNEYRDNYIYTTALYYLISVYLYYIAKSYLEYTAGELSNDTIIPKYLIIVIQSIFACVLVSLGFWYSINNNAEDYINLPYLHILIPTLIPFMFATINVIKNDRISTRT